MSTGRPRFSLAESSELAQPVPVPVPAPLEAESVGGGAVWVRPPMPVPPSEPLAEVRVSEPALPEGVFRRSLASKRNRSVSLPADLAGHVKVAARASGYSLTNYVFVAVERFCERLRSGPRLAAPRQGRVVAPRQVSAAAARALVVLYMADDEWERWRETARMYGLVSLSALVQAALAEMP